MLIYLQRGRPQTCLIIQILHLTLRYYLVHAKMMSPSLPCISCPASGLVLSFWIHNTLSNIKLSWFGEFICHVSHKAYSSTQVRSYFSKYLKINSFTIGFMYKWLLKWKTSEYLKLVIHWTCCSLFKMNNGIVYMCSVALALQLTFYIEEPNCWLIFHADFYIETGDVLMFVKIMRVMKTHQITISRVP